MGSGGVRWGRVGSGGDGASADLGRGAEAYAGMNIAIRKDAHMEMDMNMDDVWTT